LFPIDDASEQIKLTALLQIVDLRPPKEALVSDHLFKATIASHLYRENYCGRMIFLFREKYIKLKT